MFRQRLRHGHRQRAVDRGLVDVGSGLLDQVEGRRDALAITPARFRQRHAARLAQEQFHAEPCLQRFHAMADRRGSHVQFLAGTDETAVAGGGFEGAQGIERWCARHGLQKLSLRARKCWLHA